MLKKLVILFNLIFFIIVMNTVIFANVIAFNGYDLSAYGARLVQYSDGRVYIEVDSLPDLIYDMGYNKVYKINNGNQYVGEEASIDQNGALNIWNIDWGSDNVTAIRSNGANDPNQYSEYIIDNFDQNEESDSSQ